jgi:hypothetical protein
MTAPASAPALILSVSGIALEAPTIIVSPGYVSPQAYLIRIMAFVLAGTKTQRAQRRIETKRRPDERHHSTTFRVAEAGTGIFRCNDRHASTV